MDQELGEVLQLVEAREYPTHRTNYLPPPVQLEQSPPVLMRVREQL
jgi:hypothetical protein